MKKSLIAFLLTLSAVFMLTGCGNNNSEAYNKQINLGLDAVAAEKYPAAKSHFAKALDLKPKDASAKAYVAQISNFIDAKKEYQDANFNRSIKVANQVIKEKNGSDGLKTQSEKLVATVKKTKKNQKDYQDLYDKAQKQADAKDYDTAKTTLNLLLSYDLSSKYYSDIKTAATALVGNVNAALKAAGSTEPAAFSTPENANSNASVANVNPSGAKGNANTNATKIDQGASEGKVAVVSDDAGQTVPSILVGTWKAVSSNVYDSIVVISKNSIAYQPDDVIPTQVTGYSVLGKDEFNITMSTALAQVIKYRHLTAAEAKKEYNLNTEAIVIDQTIYQKQA